MCDCAPKPTKEELAKMDRWFAGEEIEGFPKHDNRILYGFKDEKYKAPKTDRNVISNVIYVESKQSQTIWP